MSEPSKDEHLLINIVTMFTQQAWVAMGKLKNPITEKTERNLQEASFYIDVLDMMKRKMAGNLSDDEDKFLDSSLSGLKMNYVEESNKPEPEASEESDAEAASETDGAAEEDSSENGKAEDDETDTDDSTEDTGEENESDDSGKDE
jgi:nucleosome binding factor SPN SPT16 subunit